jgi:periplasmic protein CpxP/Spy
LKKHFKKQLFNIDKFESQFKIGVIQTIVKIIIKRKKSRHIDIKPNLKFICLIFEIRKEVLKLLFIKIKGQNKMRRIIVFSIIIFIIVLIVPYAQPRRTPEERAQNLKEQLSLTDEQTSKVEKIYVEADQKFKNELQGNFDRDKFRTIMDTTNMEIEKLLTDNQKDAFNKLLEERRNRWQGNNSRSNSN